MTRLALPDMNQVRRVLIIRLSAIGDVIHALPTASALKDAYPHLEITWVVEEIPADVVLGNPDIHRVIVVPRSRWNKGRTSSPQIWREYLAFLADLRRQRFDVTLDLQGYAKSALMALAAGAPYRFGWWRLKDGSNLVSRALPRRAESVHRVDWFLDTVRALGVASPEVRFPLHVPDAARDTIQERLAEAGIAPGMRYVVINQAAGNPPRRWARERYGELALALAQKHRLPSVLIGTGPESSDCEAIAMQVRSGLEGACIDGVPAPLNLAGTTDLKELAALLEGSALHISGDTGSLHMAVALQIPVLAFYGSTDPAHAGPWGQAEGVLARRDLCDPRCTVRECVFVPNTPPGSLNTASARAQPAVMVPATTSASGRARCLAAISVEQALAKAEQVLQRSCPA